MAKKQVFVHTRLSRSYLALARLSCFKIQNNMTVLCKIALR